MDFGTGRAPLRLPECLALFCWLLAGATVRPLSPAVIVVDESCSLVNAVTAANTDAATNGCPAGAGADEIVLTGDVVLTESVDGTNGLPIITDPLTLTGNGFEIRRDPAAPDFRLIEQDGEGLAQLTLEDVTLLNGSLPSGNGGAIYGGWANDPLTLRNVTVSGSHAEQGGGLHLGYGTYVAIYDSHILDNSADIGGGIYSLGANLFMLNTTVSGNSAANRGGGIQNDDGLYTGFLALRQSTVEGNVAPVGAGISSIGTYINTFVTNSTVSGNIADTGAGGIHVAGFYGFLRLDNATVVHNTTVSGDAGGIIVSDYSGWTGFLPSDSIVAANVGGNCAADLLTDDGGNFDDDGSCPTNWNPLTGLDPELAENGGPTRTHRLQDGSSAIGGGTSCVEDIDQRGYERTDGACDSGAVEAGVGVLSLAGACPGIMTLEATLAAPISLLEIFQGASEGSTLVPGGVCTGTELDLDSAQSITTLTTDDTGSGSLNIEFLASDCGQLLQAVDERHCGTSNLVSIDSCDRLVLDSKGKGSQLVARPDRSPTCPTRSYLPGQRVRLRASAVPSWTIESWVGTDDDSRTDELNRITMPTGDHAVTVRYTRVCNPLEIDRTGSGSIPTALPASSPGCVEGEYLADEVITLSGATPDPGWAIGGWTGTDNDASTDSMNVVTMPGTHHTVTVDYQLSCFDLTTTHTGRGADPQASPTSSGGCPDGTFSPGEVVDLTASPAIGWEVGGWSGTNDDGSTSASNTVTMPAAAQLVSVAYEAICYPVTLGHTGEGADPTATPIATGTAWIPTTVASGINGARSASLADLDGDLDVDVIVAGALADNLTWWENISGDGSTWTGRTIATGFDAPQLVATADLDGDGDMDVAATGTLADQVTWWENASGDGRFWTEHTVVSDYDNPWGLEIADLDGDGDQDLITTAARDDEVTWWENLNGDASTWARHQIAVLDVATALHVADLDGDSDLDVVAGSALTLEVLWWENTSSDASTWALHGLATNFDDPFDLASADLDGDSDLDILGAGFDDDRVTWWENSGGTWIEHDLISNFLGASSVEAVDLDRDGDFDVLAAADISNSVDWWVNTSGDATTWQRRTIDGGFEGANGATAYDFDFDGSLDVISSGFDDEGVRLWTNTYDGTCEPGSFRFGDSVLVTALPAPGWTIGGWSGTLDDASTSSQNVAQIPAAPHLVEVHYEPLSAAHLTAGWCSRRLQALDATCETSNVVELP